MAYRRIIDLEYEVYDEVELSLGMLNFPLANIRHESRRGHPLERSLQRAHALPCHLNLSLPSRLALVKTKQHLCGSAHAYFASTTRRIPNRPADFPSPPQAIAVSPCGGYWRP